MTNTQEFNTKYKDYLGEKHYGLDINNEMVIKYLDEVFVDLIKIPAFKYFQIKLKFNNARFYTNLYDLGYKKLSRIIESCVEEEINKLIKL